MLHCSIGNANQDATMQNANVAKNFIQRGPSVDLRSDLSTDVTITYSTLPYMFRAGTKIVCNQTSRPSMLYKGHSTDGVTPFVANSKCLTNGARTDSS